MMSFLPVIELWRTMEGRLTDCDQISQLAANSWPGDPAPVRGFLIKLCINITWSLTSHGLPVCPGRGTLINLCCRYYYCKWAGVQSSTEIFQCWKVFRSKQFTMKYTFVIPRFLENPSQFTSSIKLAKTVIWYLSIKVKNKISLCAKIPRQWLKKEVIINLGLQG